MNGQTVRSADDEIQSAIAAADEYHAAHGEGRYPFLSGTLQAKYRDLDGAYRAALRRIAVLEASLEEALQ